jgi:hypothetical protein
MAILRSHRLRLEVWRRRGQLDAALAEGAVPGPGGALALRARQLSDENTRRALADAIARVVDAARRPPKPGSPRPPLQREAIAASRDMLLSMADQLRRRADVSPQATALTCMLVWDSASPLYSPSAGAGVAAWARTVIDALEALPAPHDQAHVAVGPRPREVARPPALRVDERKVA